jgi:hypothetical protein
MTKGRELFDISLKVLQKTEKAVLVTEGLLDKDGKQINHWLPFSQIEPDKEDLETGKVCVITIPQWLIEEKGLTVDD